MLVRLGRMGLFAAGLFATDVEFFEKNIRPLLAERCYGCHSSKVKSPFAGLRLDSRDLAMRGSDSGPVIVPGNAQGSRLVRALRGELQTPMPPTGRLKEEEIRAVEKWIDGGALWPDGGAGVQVAAGFDLQRRKSEHWAWQPVRRVEPHGTGHPIDRFIQAKLDQRGLKPAQRADCSTLIRRLYFDLTGLPPSPSELVDAPVYQALVDRLLASSRFGEHWARHWMDWVRYAESHGSEGDPDTPQAWRYRDYLIRAFNQDVPYDQLVREHLAGDLMPQPRTDKVEEVNESILGTAHFRMVEHGFQPVDPWEDRVKWTDNQIDVFAKAFQGLTVSCARCHDHKFDAISQRDFYGLFSAFAGARPTQRMIDTPDVLLRHSDSLTAKKEEIRRGLASRWLVAASQLASRLRSGATPPGDLLQPWQELRDKGSDDFRSAWDELARRRQEDARKGRELNAHKLEKVWNLDGTGFTSWISHGVALRQVPAGEFSIEPEGERIVTGLYPPGVYSHLVSRKHGAVLQSPRFKVSSNAISVRLSGGNFSFVQLILENYAVPRGGIYRLRYSPKRDEMGWATWDTSFWKGFTAYIEFATLDDATHIFPDEEHTRMKPRPEVKRDGRSWFGAQAVAFHDTKEPPRDDPHVVLLLLDGKAPDSAAELATRYQNLLVEAVEAWREGRISGPQAEFLDYFVRAGVLPATLRELPELQAAVTAWRRLEAEVPVARRAPGVLEEAGEPQRLLIRGSHKNFGEAVPPAYLAALGGRAYPDAASARLRLAEQVTGPGNPLTARVIVNRLWRYLMGRGIVRTVDNFGKLGDKPTHPELLDWLAARFIEQGWSMKSLIREIVLSDAYQRSGDAPATTIEADPANDLFHSMPPRRLEAESIRDTILAVTGELDLTVYGPSVDVYYGHDTGQTKGDKKKGPLDGNGRRSVYLEIRRNATNPFLEVFDFPKPASTRGQRDVTTVPAQSLAMMNSLFVIDQASKWGKSMAEGSPATWRRVDEMFMRALGRPPSNTERDRSLTLINDLAGEHGVLPEKVMTDTRVWRDFAHALFNLKEFIYVR